MSKDSFGDRMKRYEATETSRQFIPLLPIYARIDGRCFSNLTINMERPYDYTMARMMIETTRFLVEKTNAIIGYTQSDEINLLWMQEKYDSEIFFSGKVQKIVSVLASMATSAFNNLCSEELRRRYPTFDCRVFQLPNRTEAANVFLWREKDATKNAISMAARCFYSHKELQNKSSSEMQEMIFQKGKNFNDYPAFFKRGTFLRKVTQTRPITAEERIFIPEVYHSIPEIFFERSRVEELDVPNFSKVLNREAFVFDGAQPIVE